MRVSGFRSVNAALPFILALITCTPAVLAAAGAFEISLEDSTGFGPPPAYDLRDLDRKTRTDLPGADMLFSFAIIADSHIRPYGYDSTYYIKANSISRELLANFVRDINDHLPRVDFVVHLGDVTDNGSVDEFEWAGSILDSLECPLYPVVGNHDNFQSDDKQAFKDCFGLDSTHYSFDYFDMHFIVIDCTLQPYVPPRVHCHAVERAWVEQDLAANPDKPTIVLSHYNMWERGWCATFDTTCHYQEYEGVAYLRQILEEAGNVVAVLNGHVHANRVEVHNGIYYLDINATLVGRPSVRYFYVYQERIDVDYEYISDDSLFNHVQALCGRCTACFDPDLVCD
ncbi:MAG: metallophosphoesterase, partial [bacterium]